MDTQINLNQKHNEKPNIHLRSLQRAETFRRSILYRWLDISANYLEILEQSRLTLRKQKLDDLIFSKRTKNFEEKEKIKGIFPEVYDRSYISLRILKEIVL